MLDGTENKQDSSDANQDASKENQGTSNDKTYTEAEVVKIKSDALSKAGRDAQSTDAREATLKAREEAQTLRDKEHDEAEYEKVRGNPDAVTAFQEKREMAKREKELAGKTATFEREKLEHQVTTDAANALALTQGITALAEKFKVDADVLKDLALDLEHAEKVAQKLTSLTPEQLGVKLPEVTKKRDSGVTLGSGGNLSGLKPKETLKEIDRQLREN